MRRQAEAGIDVVDDGEMGKSTWITYLYERVSGLEPRMVPLEGGNILPPSRDRQAFPEFYAEHDAAFAREVANQVRVKGAPRRRGDGRDRGRGQGLVLHRADRVRPLRAGARHRPLQAARSTASRSADAFLPVVAPASVYWLRNEYYASEEEFVFAVADALHEEYRRIVDAGFLLQVDDAVLMHEYDSILSLGGSVEDYRRWAELRVEALNHALTGIPEERIRYHVCFGSWHGPHAFDPPLADVIDLVPRGERPLLPDRAGEPAARARVAALGGRQAAGGEGADPRRHHAPHERRRASRAHRRPARPARERSSAARA